MIASSKKKIEPIIRRSVGLFQYIPLSRYRADISQVGHVRAREAQKTARGQRSWVVPLGSFSGHDPLLLRSLKRFTDTTDMFARYRLPRSFVHEHSRSQEQSEVFPHVLSFSAAPGHAVELRHSGPGPGRRRLHGPRAIPAQTEASEGAGSAGRVGRLRRYQGRRRRVSSFGRAVGQQPTFAMDFLDGGTWSTLVNEAPTYMSTWSGSGYDMVWGLPMLPNSFSADSNAADTSGSAYGLRARRCGRLRLLFSETGPGDGGRRAGQLHHPSGLGVQRRLVPLGRRRAGGGVRRATGSRS